MDNSEPNQMVFLTEFIEIYRSFPCLWKVKSEEYTNREKKDEALKVLLDFSKTKFPHADIRWVKRKIKTLKNGIRKEINKMKRSQRSGASADDRYCPKLWYFNLMMFTLNNEMLRDTVSLLQGDITARQNQDSDEEINKEDSDETQEAYELGSNSIRTDKRKEGSAKMSEFQQQIMKKADNLFSKKNDEFDALGITVAAMLREMDKQQRVFAQHQINQILFKGQMKELTSTMETVDKAQAPYTSMLPNPLFHQQPFIFGGCYFNSQENPGYSNQSPSTVMKRESEGHSQ